MRASRVDKRQPDFDDFNVRALFSLRDSDFD
jgi:hypothetical protein